MNADLEYCLYSEYVKNGLDQYLWCTHYNKYCKYQRFCQTKKKVVHSDKVHNCSILKLREENMEDIILEEIKEPEVEVIEEPKVVKKNKTVKKEKAVVVLATPNFYIAEKDGHKFKKNEKNSYNKGDIIYL